MNVRCLRACFFCPQLARQLSGVHRGARKRTHAGETAVADAHVEHVFDMACGHGLLGILLVRLPREHRNRTIIHSS